MACIRFAAAPFLDFDSDSVTEIKMEQYRGTTICSVRRGKQVVMGGDGQVRVIAGFAGATADAFTLFERFEGKLEKHSGQLVRAAVEMAKDWRTDRMLRRLEALLHPAVYRALAAHGPLDSRCSRPGAGRRHPRLRAGS